MKKRFLIAALVVVVSAIGWRFWVSYEYEREKVQWTTAASALAQFRCYLGLYQDRHDGMLPKTLEEMTDWQKDKKAATNEYWRKISDRIQYEPGNALSATSHMAQIALGKNRRVVLDASGAVYRLNE